MKEDLKSFYPQIYEFDHLLKKVADFDQRQRKFSLKKEYHNQGNKLLFSLQTTKISKYDENLKNKTISNKQFDQYLIQQD